MPTAPAFFDSFAGHLGQIFVRNKEDSMRARNFLTFVVAFALPSSVLAQASSAAKARTQRDVARLVVMPASDLKWTDLDPVGAPGDTRARPPGDDAREGFSEF